MTHILLVEDSATQAAMIRGLLEQDGHRIDVAKDGHEALASIENERPDLVITDLMMPNMNGCELTREIVNRFESIPVIVVTAHGDEGLAVDALADGAVNFVPKSLLGARLVSVVGELCQRLKADRQAAGSKASMVVPEFIFEIQSDLCAAGPIANYIQKTLAFAGIPVLTRFRITSAVFSALVNAICYGNLDLRGDEQKVQELISGQQTAAECSHKVRLVLSVGPSDVRVSVAHDGPGTMTRTTPAPGTPESFDLEDCRGLMLITSFMDQVMFNQIRNEVVLVKQTVASPQPVA